MHSELHAVAPLSHQDRSVLQRHLRNPRLWDSLPRLAQSRRSCVVRLCLPCGPAVVKRYVDPGIYGLRTFARRSRAHREACALNLVGALIPENPLRVVAWAEERRLGFVLRSYLVTTEFEGSYDLRTVQHLPAAERARVAEAILRELPRRVATLHAAGVFARTLRGKNVLFRPADGRLALIDFPSVRRRRRLRPRQRRHDLATLSLELRRFLEPWQWSRFVSIYLTCARDLAPEELEALKDERIEKIGDRVSNRTPLASAKHSLARRFRHSAMGAWLIGDRDAAQVDSR